MKQNRILFFLIAIFLLALILRFYRIDFLPLWYDEADTIQRAGNFFSYIPKYLTYADGQFNSLSSPLLNQYSTQGLSINQPLYFLIMNLWMRLFGTSEIALRSFSAIIGALSVILIFLLGRRLANPAVGLLAGFLLAINPYHLIYSQEARAYTLLVFFVLAAMYSLSHVLTSTGRRWWIFLTLANALGMYTHTFFIFVIVAEIVFFLFTFRRHRAALRRFTLSLLFSGLLYLPWLPHFYYANQYANAYFWLDIFNLADVPLSYLVFSIGQTLIVKESAVWAIIVVTLLAGIGFAMPALKGMGGWKKHRSAIAFLLCFAVAPVIAAAILSLISRPIFQWRYVMAAAPAFLLLVARGLSRIRAMPLFLLIIVGLSGASLAHYYSTPLFKGDDRAAASLIQQNEQPGDIILVHSPQIIPEFKYYYRGSLPITGFPAGELTPETIVITKENLAQIPQLVNEYQRIWLVERLVHDPNKLLVPYLDQQYTRLYFNTFVWIRVYLYQK